jgi:hypothetical protein
MKIKNLKLGFENGYWVLGIGDGALGMGKIDLKTNALILKTGFVCLGRPKLS